MAAVAAPGDTGDVAVEGLTGRRREERHAAPGEVVADEGARHVVPRMRQRPEHVDPYGPSCRVGPPHVVEDADQLLEFVRRRQLADLDLAYRDRAR